MYKRKLQQVCHKNSWELPEYCTVRSGPPHNSSFHSTVSVNGISFLSCVSAASSKSAQNDSAFRAFSYLTSPCNAPLNELSSGEGHWFEEMCQKLL